MDSLPWVKRVEISFLDERGGINFICSNIYKSCAPMINSERSLDDCKHRGDTFKGQQLLFTNQINDDELVKGGQKWWQICVHVRQNCSLILSVLMLSCCLFCACLLHVWMVVQPASRVFVAYRCQRTICTWSGSLCLYSTLSYSQVRNI